MKKYFICFFLVVGVIFSAFAEPRFEADVHVDVTAKSVTDAKQMAMSKAVRDGLAEVVLRISTNKSVQEIDKLTDNQLAHFITGVMVLMEKTSDVRYIADLRIGVDEYILKSYLSENDLPLVYAEEKEALVIPLMEDEEGNVDLWSDENVWKKAFSDRGEMHKGRLNIATIDKNLGNISMIKVNRLGELTNSEFKNLADFNHADSIYVLTYSQKDNKIYIKNYPSQSVQEVLIENKPMTFLVDKVMEFFKDDESSVQQNTEVAQVSDFEKIEVVYNYSKLSEWMSLKQVLDNNAQVKDIQIVSMVNGKVHFNFGYNGIVEKLQGYLVMSGYKMQKEGEYYVIN